MKRTISPDWYIAPTNQEIKDTWKSMGLKGAISPSFIRDIANIAAGGSFVPMSEIRDAVEVENFENIVYNEDYKRYNIKNFYENYKTREEALNAVVSKQVKYHQNIQDFIGSLKFDGSKSPLTSALETVAALMQHEGGSANGGSDSDDPSLPIFQNNNISPESAAKQVEDNIANFEKMDQTEKDLADPENKWHQDGDADDNLQNRLKGIQASSERSLKTILEISRTLDKLTKMKVRKSKTVTPDPAGQDIRRRPIKDLSEISKVDSLAMYKKNKAYFLYQANTGQLNVRERITKQEKKQCLFILCDCSGSMNGHRHDLAAGIVMNRIKAVIDGTAEVSLALFDQGIVSDVRTARTPKEGKELNSWFQNRNFSGGSTDIAKSIGQAVEQITKEMAENPGLWKPELVILTDEDESSSGVSLQMLKGIKLHAFSMECTNPALIALAQKSGGVGINNFGGK